MKKNQTCLVYNLRNLRSRATPCRRTSGGLGRACSTADTCGTLALGHDDLVCVSSAEMGESKSMSQGPRQLNANQAEIPRQKGQ
jgi:hypothetical protein